MRQLVYLWLGILAFAGCRSARISPPSAPPQEVTFPELDSLQQLRPQPLVVFLQADWCVYCQHMKQTTYRHPAVTSLLNDHYYFISFAVESEAPVSFAGQTYLFEPTGRDQGVHQLAQSLGAENGVLTLPGLVILDPEYQIVFRYSGFLDGESLAIILDKILTDRGWK
jgi:thioredoxin-related protein